MSQKRLTGLLIIGLTAWLVSPISTLHAQVQESVDHPTHPVNSGDVQEDSGYATDPNNNHSYCPGDSQNVNGPNYAAHSENICYPDTCPTVPCYTNDYGYPSDPYYSYGDPNCEPQPYYADYPTYPTEPGYAPYSGHDVNPYNDADPYCCDPSYCLEYPQPIPVGPSSYSPNYPYSQTNNLCTQKRDLTSGILIGVEGFYWTIFQTNLDYVVDADIPLNPILGPGKTHFFEYDWKGGGRGYLGFHTCGWEVKGGYTWYENRASGKTTLQNSLIMPTLVYPSNLEETFEEGSGHNDLNYQTADFFFGRNLYFCCNSVTLHPFFGARGLRLKQNMCALGEGEQEGDSTKVKWDSILKSIGLHAGLDYYYSYCKNFGLFGSFSGSILLGHTNNHHLQQILDEEDIVQVTEIDLKERQYIPIAGYHLSAGIFLAAYDCPNWKAIFRLKLGYELNEWFQTPQLRRYHHGIGHAAVSSSATAGSIGLHGGFASAELTF